MRIWLRNLLGAAGGVALGLFLPVLGGDVPALFESIGRIVIQIGRYALVPVVFFAAVHGTEELRQYRLLAKTAGILLGTLIVAMVGSATVSLIAVAIASPDRIPIIVGDAPAPELPSLGLQLTEAIPTNLFQALAVSGESLLPVYLLAIVIGIALASQETGSPVLIELTNAAMRLFSGIARTIVSVLGIGLVAVTAATVFSFRLIPEYTLYRQMVRLMIIVAVLVSLLGAGTAVFFLSGRRNPLLWAYASIGPLIVAASSGDLHFSYLTQLRMLEENLGVPRRVSAVGMPLFTVFGRAGTAAIATVAFVVILRSYSSLELTIGQYLWTAGAAMLASLLLGSVPRGGIVATLALMCAWYGLGLEEAYLILLPAAPVMIMLATAMNVMLQGAAVVITAEHADRLRPVTAPEFV